jgi:hypothetical protein
VRARHHHPIVRARCPPMRRAERPGAAQAVPCRNSARCADRARIRRLAAHTPSARASRERWGGGGAGSRVPKRKLRPRGGAELACEHIPPTDEL